MAEMITDTLARAVNVNVNNNYNIVNLTLQCKIAYALMQRGYIGARLRYETGRYADFIKAREGANPIGDPVRYLSKWQIFADPSTSPADGGKIADFLQAVQCNDLDTICRVIRISISGGILQIWLSGDTSASEVQRLDEQMRRAEIAPILERYNVQAVKCAADTPELVRKRDTAIPLPIAEALDNIPTAPDNEEVAESDKQFEYLQANHPREWTRIVNYVIDWKRARTEALFKQWLQSEQGASDAEKTPTARIEDKIAEIVCPEADALQRQKVKEFYEFYTRQ